MFRYWFGSKSYALPSKTNATLNRKQQAIEDCKKEIPVILKKACTDFKTMFPTIQIPLYDENQQLFNPWQNIFYDVLLALLYLPKSIELCKDLLTNIKNLAGESVKENCPNRESLNDSLTQSLKDYNELCWIDLFLHGKLLVNQGQLSISVGKHNIPLVVSLKAYDLASLSLTNLCIISQEEASSSLNQIENALIDLNYNLILLKNYFQENLQQIIAQVFIRMTPIFNQYSLLADLAEKAAQTTDKASMDSINEKFINTIRDINAIHTITLAYGTKYIGLNDLLLQFADHDAIRVKLPLTAPSLYSFTEENLLTQENAPFALAEIKKIQRNCVLQLHHNLSITNKPLDDDEESSDDETNLARFLNARC